MAASRRTDEDGNPVRGLREKYAQLAAKYAELVARGQHRWGYRVAELGALGRPSPAGVGVAIARNGRMIFRDRAFVAMEQHARWIMVSNPRGPARQLGAWALRLIRELPAGRAVRSLRMHERPGGRLLSLRLEVQQRAGAVLIWAEDVTGSELQDLRAGAGADLADPPAPPADAGRGGRGGGARPRQHPARARLPGRDAEAGRHLHAPALRHGGRARGGPRARDRDGAAAPRLRPLGRPDAAVGGRPRGPARRGGAVPARDLGRREAAAHRPRGAGGAAPARPVGRPLAPLPQPAAQRQRRDARRRHGPHPREGHAQRGGADSSRTKASGFRRA